MTDGSDGGPVGMDDDRGSDPRSPWPFEPRPEPTAGVSPYVHDVGTHDAPSTGVVLAVAAVTDRPAGSLPPLYDAVDPDALDQFVNRGDPARTSARVTFQYAGTTVAVDSARTVSVYP